MMSEAGQVDAVVTEELLGRFFDLKKDLGELIVSDTRFTFAEVGELLKYLSGMYDPTPTSSVEEVRQKIAWLQRRWMIGQPKPKGGYNS
jgi:hypothetical protein